MRIYPQGSTWRKWDLHVHLPGTTLTDGYATAHNKPDWDRFCAILENSDVSVVGITDYFSLAGTLGLIRRFKELFPHSDKTLLPNLELRLNEAVNGAGEEVNLHVIFPENLDGVTADRFMTHLKTEIIADGRRLACNELSTSKQYASATVTRSSLEQAINETFRRDTDREDHLLILTSCKGDGIRPQRGALRKSSLTDAIDQLSDGFFGGSASTAWFLSTDRLDAPASSIRPKPVFSGSDAHSFDALEERLGQNIDQADQRNEITWIKADPTYAGLCQTLIEPEDRVRIQPTRPDAKEPYQVISRVRFPDSDTFPEDILLNPNLTSIIGSRSSGKSALLAYISHAVDPEYTIDQQWATGQYAKPELTGPAAGKTWKDVENVKCEVEWEDPSVKRGKVIYIPQNSLYALSGRPDEITAKIKPALYRLNPDFESAHNNTRMAVAASNSVIEKSVISWFALRSKIHDVASRLQDLGDKGAILAQKALLTQQIDDIRKQSALSQDEIDQYQQVVDDLAAIDLLTESTTTDHKSVTLYVSTDETAGTVANGKLAVEIQFTTPLEGLPPRLAAELRALAAAVHQPLQLSVDETVTKFHSDTLAELQNLSDSSDVIRSENEDLIAKNVKNIELEDRLQSVKKQDALLTQIETQEKVLARLRTEQTIELKNLESECANRLQHLQELKADFDTEMPNLEDIELGMEVGIDMERVAALSQDFNQRSNVYIDKDTGLIDIESVRNNIGDFLDALAASRQKIKQGRIAQEVASVVLQITEEIRFIAHMDGDRIGGFTPSSMTPGKQGLFALTLILNQSQESWPLLIDQPEDDLDSRSIYQHIVPYLNKRKAGRQIIMVTHNANLVLGADSELVIVANRHGEDRKNRNSRTFDYLGGSLEHSVPKRKHKLVLSSCGIREHACEILDGGADAFKKRKDKYRV